MATLKDKLKTTIIGELESLEVLELDSYSRTNKEVINFAYNQGIIDNPLIDGLFKKTIINQARQDYNIMTTKGRPYIIWADHVGSTDCLAYALTNDEFSEEEIEQIHFDHGQTAESFSRRYGKGDLPSVLRKELLNPKPAFEYKGFCDSHL